jgi:hypothetical protein
MSERQEQSDKNLLDLELLAEVWLGVETMPLEKLMELRTGSVLPLTHDPEGPVDLVVNGTHVARGQLVVVDGKFGFRVSAADEGPIADVERGLEAGETLAAPPDEIDKPAVEEPVTEGEGDAG